MPHRTMDISGRLVMPDEWWALGQGLLQASSVQWRHVQAGGVHLQAASILAGYALENLLKAVRIKQLQTATQSVIVSKRLRPELTTHDLVKLANDAGISLETWERFLLERLTTTIEWGGRYVAPKKIGPQKMTVQISSDEDVIQLLTIKLEQAYAAA